MPPRFSGAGRLNIALGAMARNVRPEIERALKRGALAIENRAAQGIIDPPKSGRVYRSKHRKGAVHQASAPGEFPAADSGRLHQSITSVTVQNDDAAVVVQTAANAPYASHLEFGTSKMAPRPFMTPAFRENRDAIMRSVEAAVQRAMRRGGRS